MAEYLDFGEIALWPNKNKTGKQPDVTGKCTLKDGREVFVSLWKQDKSGNPNRPSYQGTLRVKAVAGSQPSQQDFNDPIPF